jgi:hypothetical protein
MKSASSYFPDGAGGLLLIVVVHVVASERHQFHAEAAAVTPR